MALLVFLALLAAPVLEIYVIIQVGGAIGALPTIALLLLAMVVGVLVVKREGISLLRRAQEQLRAGVDPTPEVLDRLLIIAAGVLLVLPGFISGAVALLLFVPPFRHVIRNDLDRRWRRRAAAVASMTVGGRPGSAGGYGGTRVYDARVVEDLGDVTPPQWRGAAQPHADDGSDRDGPTDPGRSELTP